MDSELIEIMEAMINRLKSQNESSEKIILGLKESIEIAIEALEKLRDRDDSRKVSSSIQRQALIKIRGVFKFKGEVNGNNRSEP